jgi:hypothetical protein
MAEGIGKEHDERETFGEKCGRALVGALLYIGELASYIAPVTEDEMMKYRDELNKEEW